ncbi:MAG: metal ABC transporter permease, partial [Clostridia bacterium]|nr:metal ABC transporter permease [Clostridia bacterium]
MPEMIKTLTDALGYSFVWYALTVSVLIALCAGLLGVPLVLKRFSFIGDGLSHVAFGAVAVATVMHVTSPLIVVLPVTVLAAVLLLATHENAKLKGDSAIAMLSVSALAVGYLLLHFSENTANVSGDVCSSLFGSTSLLTLSMTDVWLCIAVSLLVIGAFVLFYHKLFAVTFDETFAQTSGLPARAYRVMLAVLSAIVIATAMELVGSLLVSALIVFPALSAMRLFRT